MILLFNFKKARLSGKNFLIFCGCCFGSRALHVPSMLTDKSTSINSHCIYSSSIPMNSWPLPSLWYSTGWPRRLLVSFLVCRNWTNVFFIKSVELTFFVSLLSLSFFLLYIFPVMRYGKLFHFACTDCFNAKSVLTSFPSFHIIM